MLMLRLIVINNKTNLKISMFNTVAEKYDTE